MYVCRIVHALQAAAREFVHAHTAPLDTLNCIRYNMALQSIRVVVDVLEKCVKLCVLCRNSHTSLKCMLCVRYYYYHCSRHLQVLLGSAQMVYSALFPHMRRIHSRFYEMTSFESLMKFIHNMNESAALQLAAARPPYKY